MSDEQPLAVCEACGNRYGKRPNPRGNATHLGRCEVCNCVEMVSPAYDYGWFRDSWRGEQAQAALDRTAKNIRDNGPGDGRFKK